MKKLEFGAMAIAAALCITSYVVAEVQVIPANIIFDPETGQFTITGVVAPETTEQVETVEPSIADDSVEEEILDEEVPVEEVSVEEIPDEEIPDDDPSESPALDFSDREYGAILVNGKCPGMPDSFPRSYRVSNYKEFNSAYKSIKPGEAIVIKNGTYNWTRHVQPTNKKVKNISSRRYSLLKKGTAEKPIYIVPETPHRVIFNGQQIAWNMSGQHNVFAGFVFKNSKAFYITGPDNRIACNKFSGGNSYIKVESSGADRLEFDNNDINGAKGIATVFWRCNELLSSCKSNSKHSHIHHNTWRNKPFQPRANAHEAMILGLGWAPLPGEKTYNPDGPNFNHIIENNLFDGWDGEDELISVKSSGNIIRNNCVINSSHPDFVVRIGYDNVITGNWIEGGAKGLRISGQRNVIAFNYYNRRGAAAIRLHVGTVNKKGRKTWSAAKNANAKKRWEYISAQDNVIDYNVYNGMSRMIDVMKGSSQLIAKPAGNSINGNVLYGSSFSKAYSDRSKTLTEAQFRKTNQWGDNQMIAKALPKSKCGNPDLFDGPGGADAKIPGGKNLTGSPEFIHAPSWW